MQTMRRKPSLFVVKTLLGPLAFWARYPDVMPGLDPGIQGNTQAPWSWIAGSSPAMTMREV